MRKSEKASRSSNGRAKPLPTLDVSAYAGQWVAFVPNTYQIIGHGPSPDDAIHGAAKHKGIEPVLYFVPKSDAFFVGHGA